MFDTLQEIREYRAGDRIQCLICDKWFKRLCSRHLQTHGMKADDYRARFGIPWTYSLTSAASRESSRRSVTERSIVNLLKSPKVRGINRKVPPAVTHIHDLLRLKGQAASSRVFLPEPCQFCGTPALTNLLNKPRGVSCRPCARIHNRNYRILHPSKKAA